MGCVVEVFRLRGLTCNGILYQPDIPLTLAAPLLFGWRARAWLWLLEVSQARPISSI